MKKLLLLSVALIAAITFASAQNNKGNGDSDPKQRTCFVDTDSNGVCDKYESGECKTGCGEGLRDGSGRGNGLRDGGGMGRGRGNGLRDGSGMGRGNLFIDADNDGVCDNRNTAMQPNKRKAKN
jgi:hypothetical protein